MRFLGYAAPRSSSRRPIRRRSIPRQPQPNTAKVSGKTRQPAWATINSQSFGNLARQLKSPSSTRSTDRDWPWGLSDCVPGSDLVDPGSRTEQAVVEDPAELQVACGDPTLAWRFVDDRTAWPRLRGLHRYRPARQRLEYTEPYTERALHSGLDGQTDLQRALRLDSSIGDGHGGGWQDARPESRFARTGSLLGQDKIWVALAFITDDTVNRGRQRTSLPGAYADRLVLSMATAVDGRNRRRRRSSQPAASPLDGVRITAQNGLQAMTDANGNFTLPNLSQQNPAHPDAVQRLPVLSAYDHRGPVQGRCDQRGVRGQFSSIHEVSTSRR